MARAQYVDRGRTLEDLVTEIGCHDSTLREHLRRHGIRKHHDIDEGWLRRKYLDRGRSMVDIARELGIRVHTVTRARDRYGIPAQDRYRRPYPQLHDIEWLRRQVAAGRLHREIAEEIGCSASAVSMALWRRR